MKLTLGDYVCPLASCYAERSGQISPKRSTSNHLGEILAYALLASTDLFIDGHCASPSRYLATIVRQYAAADLARCGTGCNSRRKA
jgi:hypothetical protein